MRSRACQGFLRRLIYDELSPFRGASPKTLIPSSCPLSSAPSRRLPASFPSSCFRNTRSFSSGAAENGTGFAGTEIDTSGIIGGDDPSPLPQSGELDDKDGVFDQNQVCDSGGAEGGGGGEDDAIAAEEIDDEQVASVVSFLHGPLQESLEPSLDALELSLSEGFVVRVLEAPDAHGENLVGFYKWASRNKRLVMSSRTLEILARKLGDSSVLGKKEAYMLWDFFREVREEEGLFNIDVVNHLLRMFWRLEKGKAALEVFDELPQLGCVANGDSYYFTIVALAKRHLIDVSWSVCEKMLASGSLPSKDKIGEIVTLFCMGRKVKEAFAVYTAAKGDGLFLKVRHTDKLIRCLAKDSETLDMAAKLLEGYPKKHVKHANKAFASVVKGLCKAGNLPDAKRFLMRMVDSGPAPGNAVFNYVITALAKVGEVADAVSLLEVMEKRGLRPDIYTYCVVMSGFTKGGMMEEAYKVFSEAKKSHSKLRPIVYNILICGYCKMEEFDKALGCLQEMKSDGLRLGIDEYQLLVRSLCLKGLNWQESEKLVEEMKESGLNAKGSMHSLIAAVKELEEEQMRSEGVVAEV